ncbi:MAG: hypothetical protein ABI678_02645 [Kofleriaceae bacterium]
MMFFAPAVIVFVGVAGKHHDVVERQLAPVFEKAGVTELVLPDADLAQIARHNDASREVVRNLHVDGVIGGAMIVANGQQTFRLVIYDGDGKMRSLGETPVPGTKLSSGDLEVLAINLTDEVGELAHRGRNADDRSEAIAAAIAAPPRPAPTRTAAPAELATPSFAPTPKPAKPAIPPPPPPREPAAPKQVADADAVSLDEIEALTGGDDAPVDGGSSTATATVDAAATLHFHVGAGVALIGRVFTPPAALAGYTSTPVGGAQFTAGISPTPRTSLDLMAERTLGMSTSLAMGTASTTISRWQVDGGLALVDAGTRIVATAGIGHRAFSIDATSPDRTPDNEYSYVALGARLEQPIGTRVVVRARLDVEPVFGGTDGMAMTLGPSTRWGLDVGAALDYTLASHLVARAGFDYQRFSWAWDGAGARGAGGGSDSYPSGTLALRTEF